MSANDRVFTLSRHMNHAIYNELGLYTR